MVEPEVPNAEQGQVGADPITPTMEEPLAATPTSPRGGAHDEGDPMNMLGYEEAWNMAGTSTDPTGAGTETARNAPNSTVQDPPMVTEQATPTAMPVIGMGLRHPV